MYKHVHTYKYVYTHIRIYAGGIPHVTVTTKEMPAPTLPYNAQNRIQAHRTLPHICPHIFFFNKKKVYIVSTVQQKEMPSVTLWPKIQSRHMENS